MLYFNARYFRVGYVGGCMNRVWVVCCAALLWACEPTESLTAVGDAAPSPADSTPPVEGGDAGMGALDADGGRLDAARPRTDAALAGDMGTPSPSDMAQPPLVSDASTPVDSDAALPSMDAEMQPSEDAALPLPVPDVGIDPVADLGPVPEGACPADWITGVLPMEGVDTWAVSGNTNDTLNRTRGVCGGGSGQHVYPFTAPHAGQYAVEVTGEGIGALGFAVVYVRVQCDDDATELACDARREPRAISLVNLAAEQTVYLVVDGIHTGNFPSTGGYRLSVYRQAPPQLDSASAWMNDENGSTVFEVRGAVGNVALEGIEYRFVDADGEGVPARGQVEPLRFGLLFDTREQADGTTAFEGVLDLNADVARDRRADVTHVELSVYDTLGARSDALLVPVADPTPLDIGEPCDVAGARDRCPEGTECFIRDPVFDPGPACHPSGQNCPADWTVIDLADHAQGNANWRYQGNLLRNDPPLEEHNRGSCAGATGFNDLFSFSPPDAGRYRFQTEGMLGDTILWVRSDCGVDGVAAEIGCNDDGPGLGRFSRVEANLDARQTVYVFVDSFGVGNRNAYLLTVSRL